MKQRKLQLFRKSFDEKPLITVKHFLNKRLKSKKHKSKEFFASYVQVTYKRYNTQFLFDWTNWIDFDYYENRFTEKEFRKFDTKKSWIAAKKEVQVLIENIIIFEEGRFKDRFSLKGIGKRVSFYTSCFTCRFGSSIEESLEETFRHNMKKRQFERIEDKVFTFSLLELIDYVEWKYVKDIRTIISNEDWINIELHYLISSFVEMNEDAEICKFWFFENGFELFENYVTNKEYLKNKNPMLKEIKKLELKEVDVYITRWQDYLESQLKLMEAKHF